MTKKNTGWFRLVALLLAVSLCFGLASCGKKQQEENPVPSVGTEKRTYTVTLKTEGGKALADVGVYFYTDSTLADYYRNRRLEAARLLIAQGDLSITHIADLLNYSSIYTFSRAFKDKYGVSPEQYRKGQAEL